MFGIQRGNGVGNRSPISGAKLLQGRVSTTSMVFILYTIGGIWQLMLQHLGRVLWSMYVSAGMSHFSNAAPCGLSFSCNCDPGAGLVLS